MNSHIILSEYERRRYLPPSVSSTDGEMSIRMDKSSLFTIRSAHDDTLKILLNAHIFYNLTGRTYKAEIPIITFGRFMGECDIMDKSLYTFMKIMLDFNGEIYFKRHDSKHINNKVSKWDRIEEFNRYIGDTYWLDIFSYYSDCVKFGNFHERT